MESEDRGLVRRCLAGERAAFDALYDRHAPRVYHLLRRLTGRETEAEDLTQEAFLAAYRGLAAWRGDAAFGTWLCAIACRLYASARRRDAREVTVPLNEADLSISVGDPLVHCIREDAERRVEAAILGLPPLFREAFVLVKVEGLSYREAARWLDVPLGTLQWRLWRAVGLLQRTLGEEETPDAATGRPVLDAGRGPRRS